MFEIMPFDRRSYRMSYNPFRELEQMEKNFWGDQQVNPFRTDISETADGYKLEADLPGFRKEDIHSTSTMTSCPSVPSTRTATTKKTTRAITSAASVTMVLIPEASTCPRSMSEGIKAAYENGVLTLTMPKKAPAKPESKHLEIE